jgi:hypothetical protein
VGAFTCNEPIDDFPTTKVFEPVGTWTITDLIPGDTVYGDASGTIDVSFWIDPLEPHFVIGTIDQMSIEFLGMPEGPGTATLFPSVLPWIAVARGATGDFEPWYGASLMFINQDNDSSQGVLGVVFQTETHAFSFKGSIDGVLDFDSGWWECSFYGLSVPYEETFKAIIDPDTAYVYYKFAFDPIMATVYVGDFDTVNKAYEVNGASLLINDSIAPVSTEVLSSHPDFEGDVVKAVIPIAPFLEEYGAPLDTVRHQLYVTGSFVGGELFSRVGVVALIGKSSASGGKEWILPPDEIRLHGDVDASGDIDIDDVVRTISVIFDDGSVAGPFMIADCDCSHSVDIDDVVYLISYIFASGPFPCHLE